jgi:tetratricopeptide (TPR) repeat protein
MTMSNGARIQDAVKAHSEGRVSDAEAIAREILETCPDDIEALVVLGIAAVKKNDPDSAVQVLRRAIELDPASVDAHFWLATVLRQQGQAAHALSAAKRSADLNPANEHAQSLAGMCLLDLNQPAEAMTRFQLAISSNPRIGTFYDGLGRALQSLGRNSEAIQAFQQVLAIGPVRSAALFRLGDALMLEPNPRAAERCARSILQMEPGSVQGNLLLARALIGDGRVAEGAEFALKASRLAPANAVPVAYYGRALQSLGRIAEADEQFKRSIELEPRQGFAYHALIHNHKVKEDERALVSKMQALTHDPGLPRREIIQLEYALGKAHEDLGDYEPAMLHFDEANRIDHELKVGVAPFRKEQLLETANFLIDTFDSEFFERNRGLGSDSNLPIFVVGMMRSGTTLTEQILSSHPEVGGAGELLFWPDNAGSSEKLFGSSGAQSPLDANRLTGMIAAYLDLLRQVAPGKSRVVDKMNTNYLLLGLLYIAFPNARVVHMRRHPVDTCLSIWATPVANGIDLCGEKGNVVFAYQQYLRVMAHWRRVLPADWLLDVQYEDLVTDRDRVTRQMVDFCGLPWDDACMKPEENVRSVKTPSVWQVRQPVYKTSMERWRKYEPWLGPFAELFAGVS